MKICILFTSILFIMFSCGEGNPNKSVNEGKVEANLYKSEEVGWTIKIPTGWDIMSMEQKQQMQKKGHEVLKDVIDGDIDYSELKNLIGFKKDPFNIFQSTSEPFNQEYEGEWEENHQFLKEIIYTAFENQGIKVDSSITIIEKIDELDFRSFEFTVYSPKGEIILHQINYSRLINGLDFSVNINYNNIRYKNEMLEAWRGSKFKTTHN